MIAKICDVNNLSNIILLTYFVINTCYNSIIIKQWMIDDI